MHAILDVPMYLKLFQNLVLQKPPDCVDQQKFFLSTWLGLVWQTFCREIKSHLNSVWL